MTQVSALIKGRRRTGTLVKSNVHTIWMQLAGGKTIKRHRIKHKVKEKE